MSDPELAAKGIKPGAPEWYVSGMGGGYAANESCAIQSLVVRHVFNCKEEVQRSLYEIVLKAVRELQP